MVHKKKEHPSIVICSKFLQGNCQRAAQDCWYEHTKEGSNENCPENNEKDSDFQFPPPPTLPPDQGQSIMRTLNMVLQKMELMEKKLQMNQC